MEIARKLSGFFTLLAFMAFSGAWLGRKFAGMPSMDIEKLFGHSLLIMLLYFFLGIYLSRLGIALINEVIEERRREEDERRARARSRYMQIVGDEFVAEVEAEAEATRTAEEADAAESAEATNA